MSQPADPAQETGGTLVHAGPTDCVSSIAYAYGFFPGTVWQHRRNAELRELRKNPNTLTEGDAVYVPPKRQKEVACATGKVHRFRRRGVPEYLRICFLTPDREPRAGINYEIVIEGRRSAGVTTEAGFVIHPIPPDATRAELILSPPSGSEERYVLAIGRLDPRGLGRGLQARLANLGFYTGPIDGNLESEPTRRAIEQARAALELQEMSTTEALCDALDKSHRR
jgi:hypothetical protein